MNKAFDRLYNKYLTLNEVEKEFKTLVMDFFKDLLSAQPENRIDYPVDSFGNRFAIKVDDEPVTEIYIDEYDNVAIGSDYETLYISEHWCDLNNEQIRFVCECLEHYKQD